MKYTVDKKGFYGNYGGAFVPEMLFPNLDELEKNYNKIPNSFVKISESGISEVESILKLREVGYQGFLIGENFMRTDDPFVSAYNFIKEVENEI